MMRRHWFPKPYADLVQRCRVPGGFLLAAAFLWLARPSLLSLLLGLPVSIAGLGLRAWAAGHLSKNEELTTSGPYAWLRNPLYLGTLITASGLVVAAQSCWLALLFAAAFLLIYLPAIELEEQRLAELFPAFADYATRVPLLLPRRPSNPSPLPFRWSLYRRNKEYKALLAFLIAAAWLTWRTL
jgi:protein-S-isoprenylcysteine O-methyltransferase Ste14